MNGVSEEKERLSERERGGGGEREESKRASEQARERERETDGAEKVVCTGEEPAPRIRAVARTATQMAETQQT